MCDVHIYSTSIFHTVPLKLDPKQSSIGSLRYNICDPP